MVAFYAACWSEQALFDAIMVGALFSFMNRVINGASITLDPLAMRTTLQFTSG